MAFYLTKPIWARMYLHDVRRKSVAALTDHFTDVFVRENVARVFDVVGDVMTFENLTMTPFCLEKSSIRKGSFNV